MNKLIKASIIIAIYNNWTWVKSILTALSHQTIKDFEIVIADDGSNKEVTDNIDKYIASSSMQIKHVWHEDKGWRKNMILNKALLATESDYLIFIDGDCIPHYKFVSDHLKLRSKNSVLCGRRFQATKCLTNKIENGSVEIDKSLFKKSLKSLVIPIMRGKVYRWTRIVRLPLINDKPLFMGSDKGILGCNFSIHKKDLMNINGFDERYVDAGVGEDTDIEHRLKFNGLKIINTSNYALMMHRHHKTNIRPSENNQTLFREMIESKEPITKFGIKKMLQN